MKSSRTPLIDNTNSTKANMQTQKQEQFSRSSNQEDVTKWIDIQSIQVDILEELLRKDREKLDSMDDGGMTLLHRSVLANRLEIVRLLVNLGANTTLASRDGWSALHLAAHSGNTDILVFLLNC